MTPNCPEGRRRGEETVFALAVAAAIRQVAGNAATGGRGTHTHERRQAGQLTPQGAHKPGGPRLACPL